MDGPLCGDLPKPFVEFEGGELIITPDKPLAAPIMFYAVDGRTLKRFFLVEYDLG